MQAFFQTHEILFYAGLGDSVKKQLSILFISGFKRATGVEIEGMMVIDWKLVIA